MRKLIPLLLLLVPVFAMAQDSYNWSDSIKSKGFNKNAIKINLSSIAIRNYHISYERQIAKKITLNLGIRIMPKGGLPMEASFKNLLPEVFEDDNLRIGEFEIGNTAITPEVRFYLSKKAMKGFYIAPYARWASFNLSVPLNYQYDQDPTSGIDIVEEKATFKGKVTSFSGGLMFGTQFNLGKRLVLDIWWLGGHYGSSSGDLEFKPDTPFSNDEQQAIRETVNSFEASPFKFKPEVTATSAVIKSDGPWAGLRGLGINLGFKF